NNYKDAHADEKEHDDDIQMSVSPDNHFSSCGDQTRKQGDKTEKKDKGKSPVVTITGFRDLNEEFEECINNISNGVNAAGSLVSTVGLNFTNNTNDFSVAGPSNAAMPILEDLSHNADDVGFRDLNEEFEECINNSSNGVNAAGSLVFAAGLNFTNNTNDFSVAGPSNAAMPILEDLSHNADDVGAEADINNMKSIVSVSPIPTTRMHKDHPTSQIIGDLSSTTQTKSVARVVRDQ
nr:hypothetical protein [Tanacetum cinerariifolium]